ncbi:DUF4265 domain-containing protein [Streptomyces sp. NPDC057257]|uniref:DUF4265 domain-containing protein n=1 Tax=Streptomyces sp. NPDC057257 TaxID=3346071 RepID=UPI0036256E9A
MTHVYVSLERDEDGYPPFDEEEIDATEMGGGRFRIEGVPVFVYGLAVGDVVKVARVHGDDRLWVTEVVEQAGHWTSRVVPKDPAALDDVASLFQELGCRAHATPFGLVAVDVPASAPAGPVLALLDQGAAAGRWHFDLGVGPE